MKMYRVTVDAVVHSDLSPYQLANQIVLALYNEIEDKTISDGDTGDLEVLEYPSTTVVEDI